MARKPAALSHILGHGSSAVIVCRLRAVAACGVIHNHTAPEGISGGSRSRRIVDSIRKRDADWGRFSRNPDVDVQSAAVDRAVTDRSHLVWSGRQQRHLCSYSRGAVVGRAKYVRGLSRSEFDVADGWSKLRTFNCWLHHADSRSRCIPEHSYRTQSRLGIRVENAHCRRTRVRCELRLGWPRLVYLRKQEPAADSQCLRWTAHSHLARPCCREL